MNLKSWNLKALRYKDETLVLIVLPLIRRLGFNDCFQHNKRCYLARIYTDLKTIYECIPMARFNPRFIEHLWEQLSRRNWESQNPAESLLGLRLALIEEWANIPILMGSIVRIYDAVVPSRVWYTRYFIRQTQIPENDIYSVVTGPWSIWDVFFVDVLLRTFNCTQFINFTLQLLQKS